MTHIYFRFQRVRAPGTVVAVSPQWNQLGARNLQAQEGLP
jgi:hypothetical protein